MEEQFILRVPPSVAVRIEKLLNENASSTSEDGSLDLSFSEDGRSGSFVIGNDHLPASLMDLPCVLESYKTYDDQTLIKTADVGQMILVREEGDPAPEGVEYRHGTTPPMRDARKRRFRREPDLNPELVQRVEKDLLVARTTTEDILSDLCFKSFHDFVKTFLLPVYATNMIFISTKCGLGVCVFSFCHISFETFCIMILILINLTQKQS